MDRRSAVSVKLAIAAAMSLAGASAMAQTPGNLGFNIESGFNISAGGSVTAPVSTATVYGGTTINVNGIETPAIETGGTSPKDTGVQTIVLYDPAFFTPIPASAGTTVPSLPSPNPFPTELDSAGGAPVTFQINGTTYTSMIYTAGALTGQKTETSAFIYGTYALTLSPTAPIDSTTYIYYSTEPTHGFTTAQLATATGVSDGQSGSSLASYPTFNPAVAGATTFTNGVVTINVAAPAPPSLLMFGVGSLPALRLLRRRRKL
jgi:hypothetical protein